MLELAVERQWIRGVLADLPVGVLIAEAPGGRIFFGNAASDRILGKRWLPSESVERYAEWGVLRPSGEPLPVDELPLARALRGERVRGETLAVRRCVEGSPVIIEVNSNPLYDEHGKIRGAVTVERDVTVKTQLA